MAGKGGIRSTSFKKGNSPIKAKGTKHKRTLLKESMGLDNWNSLTSFVEDQGAVKLIEEMKKLKGRDYVMAYSTIVEYVKPKLSRIDASIKGNIHLSDEPIIFE